VVEGAEVRVHDVDNVGFWPFQFLVSAEEASVHDFEDACQAEAVESANGE